VLAHDLEIGHQDTILDKFKNRIRTPGEAAHEEASLGDDRLACEGWHRHRVEDIANP
jgi:hypothetical protein